MALSKGKLKELRNLSLKKYRDEEERFIVEGVRMTQEAIESDFRILEVFYSPDVVGNPAGKALLENVRKKTQQVNTITQREMEAISDTVTAPGIVAIMRQKKCSPESLLRKEVVQSILVAFDGVADPGNLGSMVRTCDWFGADGIFLGRSSVDLYNPKVLRATMGSVFHLPVAEKTDLLSVISKAKAMNYRVYVTDPAGETHFDRVQFARKAIIVFGNEAWGVSDQVKQLSDIRVAIRRYGSAESLNVGVACGVILSALHKLYNHD